MEPELVVAVPPVTFPPELVMSALPVCVRLPPVMFPPVTSFVIDPFVMVFVAELFADEALLFVDWFPVA